MLCYLCKVVNNVPMKYKIDVLSALKGCGFTTYKIRKEKLLSESTVQKLRAGIGVSWENIETICRLLQCQPGDLIEYVADNESGEYSPRFLPQLLPKKAFTKYCCPFPVTFGVLFTLVWPSEWLIAVSLISNSPCSMAFWVGML